MKIICIGRNYAKHAKEMNSEVPKEPIYFLKPDSSLLVGNVFFYPEFTKEIHFEVEVVIKISRLGKHISVENAHRYYDKIGLGIDFTARDIQRECKEKGLPWEKAKAFDNAAVLSKKFIDKSTLGEEFSFSLHQNGEQVQLGNTKDLLFKFDELISYLSQFMTFKIGDLIYTGTPEGVGPIAIGDNLEGFIQDQSMFKVIIR